MHLWSDMPFEKTERAIREQCDSGVYSLFFYNRRSSKITAANRSSCYMDIFRIFLENSLFTRRQADFADIATGKSVNLSKSIEMEQSIACSRA
ncbi:hypothetical protein QNN00_21025 [Bacillus velezensis]|nr:hypothetical protein [Bacillus velezensis]